MKNLVPKTFLLGLIFLYPFFRPSFATNVTLQPGTCDHVIKKVSGITQVSGECVLIDDDNIFNQNDPYLSTKWFKDDSGNFIYSNQGTNLCGPTSLATIIQNMLKLKMTIPNIGLSSIKDRLDVLYSIIAPTCIVMDTRPYCKINKNFIGNPEKSKNEKIEYIASKAEVLQATLRYDGMTQDQLYALMQSLLSTEFSFSEEPSGSAYYVPYKPFCELCDSIYGASSATRKNSSNNVINSVVSSLSYGIIQFGHYYRTSRVNFGVTQHTYARNGGHFVALKGVDYDKLWIADPSGPTNSNLGLSYHGILSYIKDLPGSIESYIIRSTDNSSVSLEGEMGLSEGDKIGYLFNYEHTYPEKNIGEIDNEFSRDESDYFAIIQTYTFISPNLDLLD